MIMFASPNHVRQCRTEPTPSLSTQPCGQGSYLLTAEQPIKPVQRGQSWGNIESEGIDDLQPLKANTEIEQSSFGRTIHGAQGSQSILHKPSRTENLIAKNGSMGSEKHARRVIFPSFHNESKVKGKVSVDHCHMTSNRCCGQSNDDGPVRYAPPSAKGSLRRSPISSNHCGNSCTPTCAGRTPPLQGSACTNESQLPYIPMLGKSANLESSKAGPSTTVLASTLTQPRSAAHASPATPRSIFPKSPRYIQFPPSMKPSTFHIPAPNATPTCVVDATNLTSILRKGRYGSNGKSDWGKDTTGDDQTIDLDSTTCSTSSVYTPETCPRQVFAVQLPATEFDTESVVTSSSSPSYWSTPNVCEMSPLSATLRSSSDPWKQTTFDPRVWVREFKRSVGEKESTWYSTADMGRFRQEAISRIVLYQGMQNARLIPKGNGRMAVKQSSQQLQLVNTSPCRLLFSHEALRMDAEGDCGPRAVANSPKLLTSSANDKHDATFPDAPCMKMSGLSREDIELCKKGVVEREIRRILVVDPIDSSRDVFVKSFKVLFPFGGITMAKSSGEVLDLLKSCEKIKKNDSSAGVPFDLALIAGQLCPAKSGTSSSGGHINGGIGEGFKLMRQLAIAGSNKFVGPPEQRVILKGSFEACRHAPLLLGCSDCTDDGHRWTENGADFVWGTTPPRTDSNLRDELMSKLLRKRGQNELADKLFCPPTPPS